MAAYPGPRRPATAVASLHAPDMEIEEVDGYQAGLATADFELAPGAHSVLVRVAARRDNRRVLADGSLRVCFAAEAGHTYAIIPRAFATGVGGGIWQPRIEDETVKAWVPSWPLGAEERTCTERSATPVFRIAWPLAQGRLAIANVTEQRAECFRQVKARVEAHWDPIEEYYRRDPAAPSLGMRKWATVLHVRLRADGSLADTQIVVPSGASLLDQIAVSAVQQAQPFPAPPPDLVKETGVVTIPLAFEIVAAGRQARAEPHPEQ